MAGFNDQAPAKCLYKKCGKVFGNWWGLRAHYQVTDHLRLETERKEKEKNDTKRSID